MNYKREPPGLDTISKKDNANDCDDCDNILLCDTVIKLSEGIMGPAEEKHLDILAASGIYSEMKWANTDQRMDPVECQLINNMPLEFG